MTAHQQERLIFVSSFTEGDAGGIQAYRLNVNSGRIDPLHLTVDVEQPFFLAMSPNKRFLYATHAPGKFGGEKDEWVAAYERVGEDGELTLLNRQSSRGSATCYVDIDAGGKAVVLANYRSGSVAVLPVRADGSLGEPSAFAQHEGGSCIVADRQGEPHAHCAVIAPSGAFVHVADLGLDQVLNYRLDADIASLTPNAQPFTRTMPGAGPRHMTFHPNESYAYAINELDNSVTGFGYDAVSGFLAEQQTISTLPADFAGTSHCADVKITPSGKFLYGTNRGHDSIAAYRIAEDGQLSLLDIEPSQGKGPQNLAITPDGGLLLCANMPGNNVVAFSIDADTGHLTCTQETVSLPGPSCIMIV